MAFDRLVMANPYNGKTRYAPIGFSWTTFFFGIWPAIFRGSWKFALLMFLTAIATLGLSCLVWPFIYNRLYLNDLIKDGYRFKIAERNSSFEAISAYSRKVLPLYEEVSQ
ncbi:MAG: hypothetical protein ABF461_05230 [Zymomonas mobilis subsp. pomaceae]|uniref:HrgC protein n=1 Tax=Zymomonas mobilis subsp. pomaceae (strain ATCC 29192 / DSM 22645 / JCM 10191 / CCUG 17912 / NBRC 13757 / NCIMB 11200 / NRRL B-4491 / Barker I) TaxID=579138 RepID=F8EVM6_ZYMMT|nr:hypothetical protein [Zymomonas mobilis]AEI38363.1 hypothetical protein Zymop_1473 [Zymomonas mobilis subsp. pomaceae ATCC 29192]MDX5948052.1 hypothetical protein [Zymomonas mobilis subsp. pomaceae]GEB89382.1 hypothetical protein ZMO02_10190 [Zymomonas mobilis subsp. pomaceae]